MDEADVPVVNILIVVVLGLHHLVTQAEECPINFALGLARSRRVELLLQSLIQQADSCRSAIKRSKDLDVVERVKPKLLRDALAHDLHDPVCSGFGLVGWEEEEIPALFGEGRELA